MEKTIKKTIIGLLLLTNLVSASAQTQQGFVKTIGRPNKPGVALSGVSVRVKGGHNTVLSKDDGTFSMLMTGMKVGDSYSLQQVQKTGYELNEKGTIGRQYAFSDRVPLTIVMVSTSQLQADKQRIENNAYKVAEKNYHAMLAQLEKDKKAGIITIETYRQGLQDLQDKFEKYQSLIDGLAEHYAHTDYDGLDEKEREINLCIENGDLERADSLIHTIFDPVDVLKRNKEALSKIEEQMAQAQALQAQANADMAAVLKQQEKDAEHLYQLYTIALAKFDNEKAGHYIEIRAALDTTNVQWQNQAGRHMGCLGHTATAQLYYQRVLSHAKIEYGEQSYWTTTAYHNLGATCEEIGLLEQALDYFQRALIINKDVLGDDNPEVGRNYNGMGIVYKSMADYHKALDCYNRCLDVWEMAYGENHPDIATVYNNIGSIYCRLAEYNKALRMYQRAQTIVSSLWGDHPSVIATIIKSNIGYIYKCQGDYAKALECYQQALAMRQSIFGDRHPDIALNYNNIGMVYDALEKYSEAMSCYQQALDIFIYFYGEYHLSVATIYNNIGGVYTAQSSYPKAAELVEKALIIRMQILGDAHPNVAETLNNLAVIYAYMGDAHKSLELFKQALSIYETTLGAEHPTTKTVKEYIRSVEEAIR